MSIARQDYLDFLIDVAFVGQVTEAESSYGVAYQKAINTAYRDVQRTIVYKELRPEEISDFKNKCRNQIANSLQMLLSLAPLNEDVFDAWHQALCESLTQNGILSIGQAQKWVNMTLKNLCVLEALGVEGVSGFTEKTDLFHVPIDTYVMELVRKEQLGILIEAEIKRSRGGASSAWSKWHDYASYVKVQKAFRSRLKGGQSPFEWELKGWKRK